MTYIVTNADGNRVSGDSYLRFSSLSTVKFDKTDGYRHGNRETPITGNITFNSTLAIDGVVCVMIWSGDSTPTFTGIENIVSNSISTKGTYAIFYTYIAGMVFVNIFDTPISSETLATITATDSSSSTITVTVAPTLTGDTVASYNAYSSIDGLLGTLSIAEAAAGKDFSLSDGATHLITVKAVWAIAGLTTTVGSNAVSVTTGSAESWDISAATYDSISKDISGEITANSNCGLIVNPAKTKLIISSHSDKTLYQYTINANGTLTYDSLSFDYSTNLTGSLPYGLEMSHDGANIVMTDFSANIFVFDLPNAGTLTGMSFNQTVTLTHNNDARAVSLNADSTKVFVGDSTGDDIRRYSIDLTLGTIVATYDTDTTVVTPANTVLRNIFVANAGTKLYVSDGDNENIREFTMSPADELNTITDELSPLDLSAWGDTVVGGVWTDGVDLYIAGGSTQTIRKYSM